MSNSVELLGIIATLLPGFVSVYIFYACTAYTTFLGQPHVQTIVIALIFTVLSNAIVRVLFPALVQTDRAMQTIALYLCAVMLGVLCSALVNHDLFHGVLRALRITKRSAYPSEWYGIFTKYDSFVILELEDGQRLRGWPYRFPTDPKNDHFVLEDVCWLGLDNDMKDLSDVKYIVVRSADVKRIEMLTERRNRV